MPEEKPPLVKSERIGAKVTPDMKELVLHYAALDDRDTASLITHALKALFRQNRRKVPEEYQYLLDAPSARAEGN